MSTAVDYLNRQFDVLAFQGAQPRGDVQLRQSLFGTTDGGEVCTGAQKLAQRWALEFLTIKGSMPYFMSTRGSDFLTWVRQGRLRTEFDVRAYFNFAAQQVKTNLLSEETVAMNTEDRFAQATLLQITLFNDSLALTISITSLAWMEGPLLLAIY